MSKTTGKKIDKQFSGERSGISRKEIACKVPRIPRLPFIVIEKKPNLIKKEDFFNKPSLTHLDESYKDLLMESFKEVVLYCQLNGDSLPSSKLDLVYSALTSVVLAAQEGHIPPEKLRTMMAQSARQSLLYAQWEPQKELELNHNIMIGKPRTVKVF